MAQPRTEPLADLHRVGGTPLVAERPAEIRQPVVVGDDHAALARRDLLVGVEAEHPDAAESADRLVLETATDPLAAVFDQRQFIFRTERGEIGHSGRVAEHLDADDRLGTLGDLPFAAFEAHVERAGIAVNEDGRRAGVQDTVGRSDEAERGRDDLVTRPDAQCIEAQV